MKLDETIVILVLAATGKMKSTSAAVEDRAILGPP